MVGREGLDPRALGRETQRRRKTRPSTRTPVAIHGLVVLGFHAQDHGACRLGFLLASCRMEGKCLCPVCRKKAILHQLWPTATLPPDVAPSNPSTRCGPTATPPPAVAHSNPSTRCGPTPRCLSSLSKAYHGVNSMFRGPYIETYTSLSCQHASETADVNSEGQQSK